MKSNIFFPSIWFIQYVRILISERHQIRISGSTSRIKQNISLQNKKKKKKREIQLTYNSLVKKMTYNSLHWNSNRKNQQTTHQLSLFAQMTNYKPYRVTNYSNFIYNSTPQIHMQRKTEGTPICIKGQRLPLKQCIKQSVDIEDNSFRHQTQNPNPISDRNQNTLDSCAPQLSEKNRCLSNCKERKRSNGFWSWKWKP